MLSLLFLTALCEAHVRLIHSTEFTLPIRNAASPSADGTLSTDGPCGAKTIPWGRQGFSNVNVGDNISLVFAYNGGHQSPTQNILNVFIVCGDDALFNSSAVLSASKTLPMANSLRDVNASASLTSGYKLWGVVPPLADIANSSYCTISVKDKRNWGGCIDIVVAAAPVPPTPQGANALADKNLAGTYTFGEADCTPDSPGCCCVSGTATVTADAGATTGTVAISYTVPANCTNGTDDSTTAPLNLAQVAPSLASMKAQWTNGARVLTLQVQAGTPNILSLTDDSATPAICGFTHTANGEENAASSVQVGTTALSLFALSLLL